MTSKTLCKTLRHRSCKDRANARPLQRIEMIASDEDELVESLVETFPASDPPTWIPLARVGIPKRKSLAPRARKP